MLDLFPKLLFSLAFGMTALVNAAAWADAPCETVVFVTDGAGAKYPSVESLHQLAEEGHPLRVVKVAWSHGYLHNYADQTDWLHGRIEGHKLAECIRAFKQAHPHCRVCLLGYCAGCAVGLAALEELPPDAVDEVVLLAPSVSPMYDLRPALRSVRCRLSVFHSRRDFFILGVLMHCIGTSDRQRSVAAGCVGFYPILDGSADDCLYDKLYQRSWRISDWCLSHYGGHYGYTRLKFMHACVLPVLLGER